MPSAPPAPIRRRQITAADTGPLADLLCDGFPDRTHEYWARALDLLAKRDAPEGYPRFGYLLESSGVPVGVILLIFSRPGAGPSAPVRCNVSSWYVKEAFRGYATLLVAAAIGLKDVTYINSSPAEYTWPILEAQGYARYAKGQFVAVPAVGLRSLGARVRRIDARSPDRRLAEFELLAAHAAAGCTSLVCDTAEGPLPFVFVRWRLRSPVKMMRLLWCRDTADFVRCAGPIGRYLLRRGIAAVACDAVGPITGLAGRYFPGAEPKYFRGPTPPRLNDLAFTETVLFGV
ncbi:MAG TPA: hypothetical protein VII63_04880 [Caulobacteraceae bacterium]